MTDAPIRWRDRAACRDAHNEAGDWTMFPCDRFHASSKAYVDEVERLRQEWCSRCPVRAECLRDGMLEDFGIFGGLSPEERKSIMQLECHCGQPIDPLDLLTNVRQFCPSCKPVVLGRSSKV